MKLKHLIPYLAVRAVATVVMTVPLRVALGGARVLGWLTYHLDP